MGSADNDLCQKSTKSQGVQSLPAIRSDYLVDAYQMCGLDLAISVVNDARPAINCAYHLRPRVITHICAMVLGQSGSIGKEYEEGAKSSYTGKRKRRFRDFWTIVNTQQ